MLSFFVDDLKNSKIVDSLCKILFEVNVQELEIMFLREWDAKCTFPLCKILSLAKSLKRLSLRNVYIKIPYSVCVAIRSLPKLETFKTDGDNFFTRILFFPIDDQGEQDFPSLRNFIAPRCSFSPNGLHDATSCNKFVEKRLEMVKVDSVPSDLDFSARLPSLHTLRGKYCNSMETVSLPLTFVEGSLVKDRTFSLISQGKLRSCKFLFDQQFSRERAAKFNDSFSSPLANVNFVDLTHGNLSDGTLLRITNVLASHRQCTKLLLGGTITTRGIGYFIRKCMSLGRNNFTKLEFSFYESKTMHLKEINAFISANTMLDTLSLRLYRTFCHYPPPKKVMFSSEDIECLFTFFQSAPRLRRLFLQEVADESKDFFVRLSNSIGPTIESLSLFYRDITLDCAINSCIGPLSKRWNLKKLHFEHYAAFGITPDELSTKCIQMQDQISKSISLAHFRCSGAEFVHRTSVQRITWENLHPVLLQVYIGLISLQISEYVIVEIINAFGAELLLVSNFKKFYLYNRVVESGLRVKERRAICQK